MGGMGVTVGSNRMSILRTDTVLLVGLSLCFPSVSLLSLALHSTRVSVSLPGAIFR